MRSLYVAFSWLDPSGRSWSAGSTLSFNGPLNAATIEAMRAEIEQEFPARTMARPIAGSVSITFFHELEG